MTTGYCSLCEDHARKLAAEEALAERLRESERISWHKSACEKARADHLEAQIAQAVEKLDAYPCVCDGEDRFVCLRCRIQAILRGP
jgi:hypothetical protein